MAGSVSLLGPGLSAEIAVRGAELVRLQDRHGRDLLWNGDPTFWTGHAPLLFPIVGRVAGDHITVAGQAYPMRQHGLARLSDFEVLASEPQEARLRLTDNPESRAIYPFAFALEVTYRVEDQRLVVEAAVRNTGQTAMPAAFGFHPAFVWPLPGAPDRAGHWIEFSEEEPEPIRRLVGGLVTGEAIPSPVQDRHLPLDDELFAHDAVIFDRPASRGVVYRGPGDTALRIDFPAMPQLGIWSKPGAGFVCVEPWHGFASPQDFDGELADKPGMVSVDPGSEVRFGMSVAVVESR